LQKTGHQTMFHLVVVFDAHAECINKDGKENAALKVFTVDELLHF